MKINRNFSFAFFFIFSLVYSTPSFGLQSNTQSKTPIIICLKGTCSSGKSTLIKSLALLRDDLEVVDEDALVHEAYPKAIAQRFPLEYACIAEAIDKENIYHSLRTKDIIFKKTATQVECTNAKKYITEIQEELNGSQNLTWKQGVSQNISVEVLNKIKLALQNKKNVLLDAWYVKADQVQALFPKTSIIRVMLYCSLPVAYERLLKRNKEALDHGNLEEKRFLGQLVGTFCSLYQLSNQPIQAIQSIDRYKLDQIFNAIHEMLTDEDSPKPIFTMKELSQSQLQSIQTGFLQPFDDCKSEKLYISPKEKQDLIIDNTSIDIQKAVRAIEEILDGQN